MSQTGNTEEAAEYIQDGILAKYPFIQVKLMDIRENEVDMEFLEQSDAVIFGTPVYFTSMSWELKKWFDHSFKVNLSGKLGAWWKTFKEKLTYANGENFLTQHEVASDNFRDLLEHFQSPEEPEKLLAHIWS